MVKEMNVSTQADKDQYIAARGEVTFDIIRENLWSCILYTVAMLHIVL